MSARQLLSIVLNAGTTINVSGESSKSNEHCFQSHLAISNPSASSAGSALLGSPPASSSRAALLLPQTVGHLIKKEESIITYPPFVSSPSSTLYPKLTAVPSTLAELSHYLLPLSAPILVSLLFHLLYTPPVVPRAISLQGGAYDVRLHAAVNPTCTHARDAQLYNTTIRTAFASYPRSGNSYLRSLVERGTGWQTSSVCARPSHASGICSTLMSPETMQTAMSACFRRSKPSVI